MLAWINWEPGGLPRVRRRVELLNGMPLCRVEIGGRITPLLRLFCTVLSLQKTVQTL